VFLLAKTAGSLLQAGLGLGGELLATAVFTLVSGLLLLLPLLALVALGAERVQPLLRGGKQWLFARGDLLVGLVSIGLALYLGWQGVDGLRLGLGA
jgi:ABC-type nickel/cobalt efflux system permease component RcnA